MHICDRRFRALVSVLLSIWTAWRRRSVGLSTNEYIHIYFCFQMLMILWTKWRFSSARTLSIKELSIQVPGKRLFFLNSSSFLGLFFCYLFCLFVCLFLFLCLIFFHLLVCLSVFVFVSLSVPCYAIDIIWVKSMGFITASYCAYFVT